MHKTPLAVSATVVLAFTLAGCGSSKGGGTDPSSNSNPSGPQGFDTGQLAKIQDCLKAAGLASDLPTDIPSGVPSNLPSDLPTDASGVPTGVPSGMPSGMPSGGPGGALSQMNDPQVQAALKACGITLPQRGGGAPPS